MTTVERSGLSEAGQVVHGHYRALLRTRRIYTLGSIGLLLVILIGALLFAEASNSGKFIERLPYFFDFFIHFQPDEPMEVVRAMFDLPSPYADGSFKYDYEVGRVYVFGEFYIPEYFYQLLVTINVAFLATLIGLLTVLNAYVL